MCGPTVRLTRDRAWLKAAEIWPRYGRPEVQAFMRKLDAAAEIIGGGC